MKRMALAALMTVAAVFLVVPSSHAGPRRGPEVDVFIGVGPTYRYAPPPYYVYPPYYAYPPPPVLYSAPPVVYPPPVVVAPPVYAAPPPAYWYYCRSHGAYYPNTPACPEPWVSVPAR